MHLGLTVDKDSDGTITNVTARRRGSNLGLAH